MEQISLEERKVNLKSRISQLNNLCHDINPYAPLPNHIQEELRKFEIVEVEDPFSLTNKLILLLEDSIEELHAIEEREKKEITQ